MLQEQIEDCIYDLFTTNNNGRFIHLPIQFHSSVQFSLSLMGYMRSIMGAIDALCDVGCSIQDDKLVLNVLRCLPPTPTLPATDGPPWHVLPWSVALAAHPAATPIPGP